MIIEGAEIVELFEKARKAVCAKSRSLGEIGDFLRNAGYYINYDGFSVCDFRERDLSIRYKATCYEGGWNLCEAVSLGKTCNDWIKIVNLDPKQDYGVDVEVSLAKRFAAGEIKPRTFLVVEQGSGAPTRERRFDTFEQADEAARQTAQKAIDWASKDGDLRRYTASRVVNWEQRADELDELRHYMWYDFGGHRQWVSVKIGKE